MEAPIAGQVANVASSIVANVRCIQKSMRRADINLHDAAMGGNLEEAKKAVAEGADVNSQEEEHCITPLLWACSSGHMDVVSFLVDAGANINYADENLSTPLHKAIVHGFPQIVRLLLERGAKTNILDGAGSTPLEAVVSVPNSSRRELVDVLLDFGCDVNECSPVPEFKQRTPLMVAAETAAESGNTKLVSYLLSLGADKTLTNAEGYTAADYTSWGEHKQAVLDILAESSNS